MDNYENDLNLLAIRLKLVTKHLLSLNLPSRKRVRFFIRFSFCCFESLICEPHFMYFGYWKSSRDNYRFRKRWYITHLQKLSRSVICPFSHHIYVSMDGSKYVHTYAKFVMLLAPTWIDLVNATQHNLSNLFGKWESLGHCIPM